MKKPNKIIVFILYIALINPFVNINVQAETFNGADVIADAHSFQCLDYEIIMPICVYLLVICTPWGCYFKYIIIQSFDNVLTKYSVSFV